MATHSSVLAWRIPGMGEAGWLPSVGLHRVSRTWLQQLSRTSMFEGLWNRSEEVLRSGAWLWRLCGVNIEETWVFNKFCLHSGAPELGFLFWKVRSCDTLEWHLRVTWEASKTRNALFQPRRFWLNLFGVGPKESLLFQVSQVMLVYSQVENLYQIISHFSDWPKILNLCYRITRPGNRKLPMEFYGVSVSEVQKVELYDWPKILNLLQNH